jgi:hypothetical protein
LKDIFITNSPFGAGFQNSFQNNDRHLSKPSSPRFVPDLFARRASACKHSRAMARTLSGRQAWSANADIRCNRAATQVSNIAQTAAADRCRFLCVGVLDFQLAKDSEFPNMQTYHPAFHVEYWIYLLAAFVIIGVGTLLYTVDGPINISNWF